MSRAVRHLGDLCRPLPVCATLVLGLNDHLLKGAGLVPAAVTGKLSDVAGLFLFPILVVALARTAAALGGRALPRHRVAGPAALATAAGFAAVKLWPGFNAAVALAWGPNVMDPGDLWALPMTALAWLWLLDRDRAADVAGSRWSRAAALLGVLAVCAATPAPQYPRNYPRWEVSGDGWRQLACGQARAWVSKSGKTGVGLSIEAPGCELAIEQAELRIEPGLVVAGRALVDDRGRPYLAFEFDNEALWNQGRRTGTFALVARTGGEPFTWELAAEHRLAGYHGERGDDGGWDRRGR